MVVPIGGCVPPPIAYLSGGGGGGVPPAMVVPFGGGGPGGWQTVDATNPRIRMTMQAFMVDAGMILN